MPVIDLGQTMADTAAAVLAIPPARLHTAPDLALGEDDALALLLAVEAALDCRFPDDFLDGISTYGEFTRAVRLAVGP
ncbi:MAG: hypothetical protein U0Q15_16120 [Kineosporiaceae bacterium]